jgi:Eukaryotic cytochrome b561.
MILTYFVLLGQFSMNMKQATGGTGGLPSTFTTATGSEQDGDISDDSDWPAIIHGIALCVAFVIFMPIGVIFLRISPSSVRWHWVNQTLATILVIIGMVFGFYLSTMYNKSESFNSAHQIIGIIVLAAVVLQWFIGFWHHILYKKFQRPTYYGIGHRYFGRIVIVLAIVNGGIGLTWSYATTGEVVAYSVIVGVLIILTIAAVLWKRTVTKRQAKMQFTRELELHQQEDEDRFKNPVNPYTPLSRAPTDPNGHLW